jgi:hypothetical protein
MPEFIGDRQSDAAPRDRRRGNETPAAQSLSSTLLSLTVHRPASPVRQKRHAPADVNAPDGGMAGFAGR